jgi:phospholipid/cholesterol/gamma-HCH transport system substrate-binding protein
MKINNETKVGALTAIAITMLILGFNFLKGKSLFKTGNYLFAKYTNTKGIMVSNGVFINGFKVGSVYEIENSDPSLKEIVVTIKLEGNFNIPKNSVASIKESALSAPSMEIVMGNDPHSLNTGDTIITGESQSLIGSLGNKLAPVGDQLKTTMHSVDSLVNNVNSLLDADGKGNLKQSIANINKATASLLVSAASIERMLNAQSGVISQTMANVNGFTKNLADNNDKITKTMANMQRTTENLANADIDGIINSLKKSTNKLTDILEKVDNKEGTIGLLVNDKQLYYNLTNAVRSANILMDDLKVHPKRYINILGRRDKTPPLTAPLNDSATHP